MLDVALNAIVSRAATAASAVGWEPIWKDGWRPTEFGYMSKYVKKNAPEPDTFVHVFVQIGGARDHLVRVITREYKYVSGSNNGNNLVRIAVNGGEIKESLRKQAAMTADKVTEFFRGNASNGVLNG